VADSADRQKRLAELQERVRKCLLCELERTRTNVVFGSGSSSSKLMFVGEAPGYHEDQQGLPFVGRAGQLLAKLLERIGLNRDQIYIANVLKCRPPDNRDPLTSEIQTCRAFLDEQIAIIKPMVICTLGNFSTKLLSGRSEGISRIHGQQQDLPGHDRVLLFPVYHPAAALYTPANLKSLEADFDRLPALLGEPMSKLPVETLPAEAKATVEPDKGQAEPEQLGLF